MNTIRKARMQTIIPIRHGARLLLAVLFAAALGSGSPLLAQASPAHPPYPDVQEMIREPLDNVPKGTVACSWDALRYRMRGNIYQSNPGRLDNPRLTQFERLVRADSEDVAAVNREIVDYCTRKQAEIEAAWRDPKRRHPAKEVCQYQTELIPLAILSLRIGERVTPEAHQAIKDVLTAFRPETADVEPTLWMQRPSAPKLPTWNRPCGCTPPVTMARMPTTT
jgi:hypothetical protein